MNRILELIEKAGDILKKSSVLGIKGQHYFISVSEDDSKCIMVTHSTGANKMGRVPEDVPADEVLQWYVTCNYAVGDKKLIYLDISRVLKDKINIIGGGCLDCSQTFDVTNPEKLSEVTDSAWLAIMQAMNSSSLRGMYFDREIKDVYNQYCYKIFADSRLHDLQQNKNFIKYLDITNEGIFIEWNGDDYTDKARQEIERIIATPHYSVYPASDARSKGNMYFRIGK